MKIKYIISLSMLVALIGASCWGAAESDKQRAQRINNDEQLATGINDEKPAELFAQQDAPGAFEEMPREIFDEHILKHMPAAKLMEMAFEHPGLYKRIKKIPQFIQLQQNMKRKLGRHANNKQQVFLDAAQSNYPGAIDVVDYLAPHVNLNAYDANDTMGYTALMSAVSRNNLDMAKLLLAYGANINAHDAIGYYTALVLAASKNNLEMAKLLLANGTDINVRDIDGYTALMLAASSNNLEMVKLFLDKGAHINVRNTYDDTALSLAERNLTRFINDQNYQKRACTRTIIDLLTQRRLNP